MEPIRQHMLALLNSAFLARNVKAVQYKENMEPMRELTVTAVDMENGIAMALDEVGRLVSLDLSSDILLPKPEDSPSNESGPGALKIYKVPFAYEMYGYIQVAVKDVKELRGAAQEMLDDMSVAEMEKHSTYPPDSEELDMEGLVLDMEGRTVGELSLLQEGQ